MTEKEPKNFWRKRFVVGMLFLKRNEIYTIHWTESTQPDKYDWIHWFIILFFLSFSRPFLPSIVFKDKKKEDPLMRSPNKAIINNWKNGLRQQHLRIWTLLSLRQRSKKTNSVKWRNETAFNFARNMRWMWNP